MMTLAKAMRFVVLLGSCLAVGPMLHPGSQVSAMPNPPYEEAHLWCGANPGAECSFILWDGHGSRGFVVAARQLLPIGNAYNGFNYCMHAGPIHAPSPNWPGCINVPNTATDSHGVVHVGNNG